jgi:diacylglycerol kinase (ATP)
LSRPVVVVVNRNALHLREEGPLLDALREARSPDVLVRETRSLDELSDVFRSVADRDTRTVVLAGGDGTLMAGLSEMRRAFDTRPFPTVAVVPGGTVCTIGRNLGIRGNRASYTRMLLRALTRGTAKHVSLRPLQVRDYVTVEGREVETTRVGFIFGFGLVSSFFDAYYGGAAREALGLGAAARIVAEVFAGSFVGGKLARRVLTPQPAELHVDGKLVPHDGYSLFVASVVRDLGLHMHLTYRAGERADRFHAVGSALGPAALGPQMPLVLAGKPLRGGGVDALSSHLSVRFPGDRRGYVLDGELFQADRIDVSLAREHVLAVPR